jgi:hypothetical protein
MTAAPHPIATAHSWRSIPISPLVAAETAAIVVFALIVIGFVATHARAAMQSTQASAAAAEIRILDPIVDAYGLDHSSYTGMTPAALKQDYGVQLDNAALSTLVITGASTSSYCIQIRDGALYAAQQGPSGAIETSRSPVCL